MLEFGVAGTLGTEPDFASSFAVPLTAERLLFTFFQPHD